MNTLKAVSPLNELVLILTPTGSDAELAASVLQKAGIEVEIMRDLWELVERMKQPVGAVLIAEEALEERGLEKLKVQLDDQEPWSDLPLVVLTSGFERATPAVAEFSETRGNISILERPFQIATFLSVVKVALRSRRRQYLVRDLMQAQEDAVKQRDEFLSVASHELKTPLTSLKLQVQLRKRIIGRGDPSADLQEKVLSLINKTENQVSRLSRLVDDMLDVSRIENGKLSLNPQLLNLNELVAEVIDNFRVQMDEAGSEVKFKESEQIKGVWDRYRIEQVISNLLSNACKYGQGRPVNVSLGCNERFAELTVHDQGIGIAPENQRRIFQRFERAAGVNVSGLGLGLYISNQIVQMHGGEIQLKSSQGKGSSFIVRLPLAEISAFERPALNK